jgi:hypothetical protein
VGCSRGDKTYDFGVAAPTLGSSGITYGDDSAGMPTGSASARRQPSGTDVEAAANDDPRDDRIRVPHLPCAQLIPTPNGRRHSTNSFEDSLGEKEIVRQALRAVDGLVDVRNDAVAPAMDLVAEQLQPTCGPRPDRALGDNTTLDPVAGPNWRLLDHVPSFWYADFEGGVVEVASISLLYPRRNGFEDAAV